MLVRIGPLPQKVKYASAGMASEVTQLPAFKFAGQPFRWRLSY